jgi:hypothetical protein
MGSTMKQGYRKRLALSVALMAALLSGAWADAQLAGRPEPKRYPWSDASLSADARAVMVIQEMTVTLQLNPGFQLVEQIYCT